MENPKNSNSCVESGQKLTLRGYYKNLPCPTHPKKDLIRRISGACGVTECTARNWVVYSFRPNNPEHTGIISEITGIPVEDLWND